MTSIRESYIIISIYNTIMINRNLDLSCRVYVYYTYTKSRNFLLYSLNLVPIISMHQYELAQWCIGHQSAVPKKSFLPFIITIICIHIIILTNLNTRLVFLPLLINLRRIIALDFYGGIIKIYRI